MASHSPKRRKLDRDGTPNLSMDDNDELSSGTSDGKGQQITAIPGEYSTHKRASNGDKKNSREMVSSAMYAADYKSSMFKLQMDEMLGEIQPNYSKSFHSVNDTLHLLKTLIEKIEDREPVTISEAINDMKKLDKILIPFPDPQPPKNAAYKLAYARPSYVNVVGSYALKTMTKDEHILSVDMVVTMPTSLLQEKDYLNYRYFYKRAYYLSCLAAGLEASLGDEFRLRFKYLNGNSLQPILVVSPAEGKKTPGHGATECEIHIIPAAPADTFSEVKLRPAKNAIRPIQNSKGAGPDLLPTPFYNASVQADCSYAQYLKLQHHTMKYSDGYRDACLLGRTWLRQRGFGSSLSRGGFGSFEWSILMASLLQGGGPKDRSFLSQGYSSYQLFKATLQYISTTDLASRPFFMHTSDIQVGRSDTPIFYDGARRLNLFFKMSASSYILLREESRLSLEMLNEATFDQFEAAFILRKDHSLYQFDSLLEIPVPAFSSSKSLQDHRDNTTAAKVKIYDVLMEGLSDRVQFIHVSATEAGSWPLYAVSAKPASTVRVGVVFDPANIDRLVDHGPAAEDKKKAAKFQSFWGEKADLRRFKDGSILESLVWSNTDCNSIFEQIVNYVLKRHVGESATFVSMDYGQILPGFGTGTRCFSDLKEAYKVLENDIRALESLPLQLRQLSAVDPQLRFSSVQPPNFSTRSYLRNPANVVIQFEGSGRWPDDVGAIQRTKVALLLKIGELLEASIEGLIAKLGLENVGQSLLNCAYLDVLYSSGAVFRLRIFNDREQTLLDRQIKDKSSDAHGREEAASAMSLFKRNYLQLPLHTQSVATHCTRFPLLSSTMRLVKMWFQAHMLSKHVSEEIIELLVLRVFLQPYPWRAPSSAMTGFLRTLHFIAGWDWRSTPLIVDFGGAMTEADVAIINTRMAAWRKIDTAMNRVVLFVASNHDSSGTVFSDGSPLKVVAARMTALARSASSMAKDLVSELDPRALFKTSTRDYDFILHISPKVLGNRNGKNDNKSPQYKNLEVQSGENIAIIDYDPVSLFVEELKATYTTSIVFFHDALNNSVVGGLWNPQTLSRPFKVNMAFAAKPILNTSAEDKAVIVEIDKTSILAEIARIGAEFVVHIDVKQ